MDDLALTWVGWAVVASSSLVGLVLGGGAILYASDFAIEATVVGKECAIPDGTIHVRTKLFSIDHSLDGVPVRECGLLQPGNFAVYHVRSKHTILYETEGGPCIFDSQRGVGC